MKTPNGAIIYIAPHGYCAIVTEHGREWAVCNTCGAQYALDGDDLEIVSEGDGYCLEHADDEQESKT